MWRGHRFRNLKQMHTYNAYFLWSYKRMLENFEHKYSIPPMYCEMLSMLWFRSQRGSIPKCLPPQGFLPSNLSASHQRRYWNISPQFKTSSSSDIQIWLSNDFMYVCNKMHRIWRLFIWILTLFTWTSNFP